MKRPKRSQNAKLSRPSKKKRSQNFVLKKANLPTLQNSLVNWLIGSTFSRRIFSAFTSPQLVFRNSFRSKVEERGFSRASCHPPPPRHPNRAHFLAFPGLYHWIRLEENRLQSTVILSLFVTIGMVTYYKTYKVRKSTFRKSGSCFMSACTTVAYTSGLHEV